jgi:hypothetical protein
MIGPRSRASVGQMKRGCQAGRNFAFVRWRGLSTVHAQGAGRIHQPLGPGQRPWVGRCSSLSNRRSVLIIASPIERIVKLTCARAEHLKRT